MRSWKSWKIWQKLHFGLHTSSDPSGQHNSLQPSPRASSKERVVCVPDSDGTAPIETCITPSPALLATTPQFPTSSSDGSSSQVEGIPGWKHTAYAGTKIALEVVRESSDMFLPLKGVVGGLAALLKHYDQFISNKDDIRRLAIRAEWLITSLTKPPGENDIKEKDRRVQLGRRLTTVLETLNPMVEQSSVTAFLNNVDQSAKITGLVEDIRDAIIGYQTSLQQDLNENTVTILEAGMFFGVTPSHEAISHEPLPCAVLFEKLSRAKGAGYASGNREKCLKGTRVKVLASIEKWVQDRRSHRVYWLNGIAGTGKTTIAQSLAERMFAEGLLGASFFCSRDFTDRKGLHFIFPTLAFQLAYKYPDFRAHLVQILTTNPDICHESLSNQLTKLLVEPLQSTGLSTVIIIDALDECDDKEPASAILSLLAREIGRIPTVKFFITGRPEPRIRSGFRLPTLRPQTEVLLLHGVERHDVDNDIRIFLEHRLTELAKNRSDIDADIPWPTAEDIQIVTAKTAGLFIYASTVVRFLASISHPPRERLRLITSMPNSSTYEGQAGIDRLYTCLLDDGCSHIHPDDSQFFPRLLLIVSSVILLCQPIPISSLAILLGINSESIFASIRPLHSVLLVPDSDSEPIRVFHKSFPDYLTDRRRCEDPRFFVDSSVHHASLAISCLELMEANLKESICDLPRYSMNDNILPLSTRRHALTDKALGYACKFWAKHICSVSGTGDILARILELLNELVQRYLLQWLEAQSLMKDLHGAVHSLLDVEQWLLKLDPSQNTLVGSVSECLRFVLHCFDGIEQSAAHIYDSALVWPPEGSLVQTKYKSFLRTPVRLLTGLSSSWDTCVRSVQLGNGDTPPSVAFSHGGNLIAGSTLSVIKVLEAATGICLATLIGHDNIVNSIAFSLDDVFLASGSADTTIRIWDVQTGAIVRVLEGHENPVNSVAFSPTGTMLVSGGHDEAIRIWNLPSGMCESILGGHSGHVESVCWCGRHKVVSGCGGGEIKVWDVSSRECLKSLSEHTDCVRSVASSPDACKIASGSDNGTIHVYDAETGRVLQTIVADEWVMTVCFSLDGDKVVYATRTTIVVWDLVKKVATFNCPSRSWSMAWSPDGNYVAVGSSDGFVKVIQIQTRGQDQQDLEASNKHSNTVLSVAFAADGRTIASGSKDETVKLWDVVTGSCLRTFRGHNSWIRSVTFSPDSSLVASGSSDSVVRIWSVHSAAMNPCLHAFCGHFGRIHSVAFSPNSLLVASGSDDKTVRIWSLHNPSLTKTLKGHGSYIVSTRFSPDGKRIVSAAANHEIILWDVEKGERLACSTELPPPRTRRWDELEESDYRVFFSIDGARIVLQFRDIVKRWKICDSAGYFKHVTGSPDAKYSPDNFPPAALVAISDDEQAHDDVQPYRYPSGSEWVLDRQDRRVCWIPADRRGFGDTHGSKVVLVSVSGVVVLDFSGAIFD